LGRPATASADRLGEFDLIRRFFDRGPSRSVELGIGDDCALIAPTVPGARFAVSTDMLVEGRHFFADVEPRTLGHKALAVNLSDLAAMGATPRAFTLALALPEADPGWLGAFSEGLFAIADRFGCELIGGDTTRGPLNVCITVLGELPGGTALRRDRAQPGDDLWVSGELGAAAFAVRQRVLGQPLPSDHPATHRLESPEPRIALGVALRHLARAAIDLSDGLSGDLGHVCERSRVGARVEWPRVPVAAALAPLSDAERAEFALAGGDDYELLFSAAPENRAAIESLAGSLGLRLTRIGTIDAGQGVRFVDARGAAIRLQAHSYDHFG
jgi:thiamine-monophosphate kinase